MTTINDVTSQDRARAEFHVHGILGMLADRCYGARKNEERDDIDFNARWIINKFVSEADAPRFNHQYSHDKDNGNPNSNSIDTARIELHVSGLLEILAGWHEKEIDGSVRENIDGDASYLIARLLPEQSQQRFSKFYEDYKNRLNLKALLNHLAEAYRKAEQIKNERGLRNEIDSEARHFISEFIEIEREREMVFEDYMELTGRKKKD